MKGELHLLFKPLEAQKEKAKEEKKEDDSASKEKAEEKKSEPPAATASGSKRKRSEESDEEEKKKPRKKKGKKPEHARKPLPVDISAVAVDKFFSSSVLDPFTAERACAKYGPMSSVFLTQCESKDNRVGSFTHIFVELE